VSASGDVYEGEWKQDKREGKGKWQYHNGDKYSGEWKGDMRHGHGVCVFADGTKYRGEWTQDKWIQSSADPEVSKLPPLTAHDSPSNQPILSSLHQSND